MKTRLIKIGNSQGVIINGAFLRELQFDEEVEIEMREGALMLKPIRKSSRHGWEEQFQAAIAAGELPEGEMLEGFSNDFDTNGEWTWE